MTTTKQQDLDFDWFLENYQNLFKKFGVSYLAIKNNSVLGSYDTYADAVTNTEKTEKLGSFIVQYCNGDESGYTVYIAPVISVGGTM